jgi:SAM-dependent methyltransferase
MDAIDASLTCECHICGGRLSALPEFATLVQVTSDCRPWRAGGTLASCESCGAVQKPATPAWLDEARAIYAEYAVYSQGGGAEQSAFDPDSGANTARSNRIVEWLAQTGHLPATGTMLDVGCGNGAFLRAFSQQHPQWRMAGLELGEQNRAVIEAIPGVTQLYVGSIDQVAERFDLIVLIHALEHIPQPARYLELLASRLKPGGILLIEVPDLATSPFDILIADHTTHFTVDVLEQVVADAGFDPLAVRSGYVPKELSLIARHAPDAAARPRPRPVLQPLSPSQPFGEPRDAAHTHIAWLHSMLGQTRDVTGVCGIFGTSISATWLAASLAGRASFFVDEDRNRIGRTHMDRPIYAPLNAPDDATIFVPLRTDIASAIARRFEGVASRFVLPPQ